MELVELQQQYRKGRRDFSWIQMPETSLTGSQFPEILMPRSCLAGSNFDTANFSHASFRKANLANTSWQQTQAEAAIFVKANLQASNFTQANLANADLSGANLAYVDFTNANLEGANLSKTCLQGTIFRNANLKQAKFYDADTTATSFDGVDCSETYFSQEQVPADTTENVLPETTKTASYQSPFIRDLPKFQKKQYSFFSSHRGWQGKGFWRNLPKKFLLAWGLGYFLLAQGMVYNQAGWAFWLLAICSSVLWSLDEQLIWFLPIAVFLATFSSDPLVILMLFGLVPMIIFVTILYWFQVGWHFYRSLKLTVFITGTFLVVWSFIQELLLITGWLSFFLFLQFFLSVVGVAAGSFAIVEMGNRGYSKKQTLSLIFAIAVSGLALGRLVS
jgi:hypothetical protein